MARNSDTEGTPSSDPTAMPTHSIDPNILTFMRYLDQALLIEAHAPLTQLDAVERQLLEIIVSRWSQGQTMTVREVMDLQRIGSPATMHRKLAHLRQAGFVQALVDEDDTRIKHLHPGEPALAYFSAMGSALQEAAANGAVTA